ncbi:MAG: histidine phosphatase family protein [Rectinemataceae bacterium]
MARSGTGSQGASLANPSFHILPSMYSRIELPGLERFGADRDGAECEACGAPIQSDGMTWTKIDGEFFADLPAPASFFILRHGQSEGNSLGIYQGRLEFPLDEAGRAQARVAGAWLAGRSPDTVICSPQRRASETARIVAEACGCAEPTEFESLAEVETGLFSGMGSGEAERRHPEVFREFYAKSWDAVPGAEHSSSMYARAVASWTSMRDTARNGARGIVCVSHGGLIQWLIRSTFGGKSWLPLLPLSNCGISEYRVEPPAHGGPAFVQWSMINFRAPGSGGEIPPVF